MGASSGSSFWPTKTSPRDLKQGAISQKNESSYNSEINAYFQNLLSNYNTRDIDKIRVHLETIVGALTKDDIGTIQLLFGGSIKKETYVDGLSDIDVLAIINKTELKDKSPQEVLDYFYDLLTQRFPNTEITKGKLAVTVKFSDGCEIQILPALKTATGVKIANLTNDSWSNVVKPDKFASKLTEVNQQNNNGVVPVIKLFKSISSNIPEESRLKGYHIESIAIEAFSDYDGPKTRKAMLLHFTEYAINAVNSPIQDSTGQSLHVDDYLGEKNSIQRQRVNQSLKRIHNQMKVADSEMSLERWKEIME